MAWRAQCSQMSALRCFCSFWMPSGNYYSSFRPPSSTTSPCYSFWRTTSTRPCSVTSYVTIPERGWRWGWWAIRSPYGPMYCRGKTTSLRRFVLFYDAALCMYTVRQVCFTVYVCMFVCIKYECMYVSMPSNICTVCIFRYY